MFNAIYLDMDGTIADLYGVENWLDKLIAEDVSPYLDAEPMFDVTRLNTVINQLSSIGVEVNVISWAAKSGGAEYARNVRDAKIAWLAKYLPSISCIDVVPYGTNKRTIAHYSCDIAIIDDDITVHESWIDEDDNCVAYYPYDVCDILETILRSY